MYSKPKAKASSFPSSRRTADKNLTASEQDILLEMMIKEARARQEKQLRKQLEKFGLVKIEEPYPYIKIEESDEESFQERNQKIFDKKKHIFIKKGILNIKISVKKQRRQKKIQEGAEGWFSNQSTLDKYVTNQILNSHKGKSKMSSSLSASQMTLDSYFAIKTMPKEAQ